MAGFCVNCGAPLTGAFCNKCGARAAAPSPAAPAQSTTPVTSPPPPAPAVAPPAPAKGSGIGKILLVIGGVLVLLFVIGIAAAAYGVFWMKHKVASYTSAVSGGSSETVKVVEKGNSCRLLSKADLQEILGVTVDRNAEIEEDGAPGCAYYTNAAAFKELQRMSIELARKQSDEVNKRPGPKPDNLVALLKDANQMEGIVKSLGLTQPPQDGRVFAFTVQRDFGPDKWSGVRLTEATVPGFEEVPGVGDHAMIGSFGHTFNALKGDAFIHLDTLWVPDARTRGAALATKIMGNL